MRHRIHDRTRPVPEPLTAFVVALVDELGPTQAAAALGVSRPVVLAVVARTGVLAGSIALLELARQRRVAA